MGCVIFFLKAGKFQLTKCNIINYLLTLLARTVRRNIGPRLFLYGPRARFVRS